MRRSAILLAVAMLAGCGGGDDEPDRPRTKPASPAAGAPTAHAEANTPDLLSQRPYMGVSCPKPNSIDCDRVGLAVWLKKPARSVLATIAGQRLELNDEQFGGTKPVRRQFAGFLQPAGLRNGALKVQLKDGRWEGDPPVKARVRLLITREGGAIEATTVTVRLNPGWG